MKVVTLPTKTLREPCTEVDLKTLPQLQEYIDELIQTMYDYNGIGIASPQVGKNIRLVVVAKDAIKHTRNRKQFIPDDLVLVNPEFIPTTKETTVEQEGCLSVPGLYGDIERILEGTVNAFDRHGNPMEFEATDFFARVIQHEIAHIDGWLFIDKATNVVKSKDYTK